MIKYTYTINGKTYDKLPSYIAVNGFYVPVNDSNFTINRVQTVIDDSIQALARTKFTKLEIRRALRALNQESLLDTLLQNTTFAKDWNDAIEIDLADPMTAQVINELSPDLISSIKLKIAGL